MSAKLPVEILLDTVVDRGLCTRCGTCVGVCPTKNIQIKDPTGNCLPVAGDDCTSCGLCLNSCPGKKLDFSILEKKFIGNDCTPNYYLGCVRRVFLGYASDKKIRADGASGGVVTALLVDMLDRGEIDGSVLFSPMENEPWRSWGTIAVSDKEILNSSQSRYQLSPMNTVLSELDEGFERLAYVGLPCHIHGLRKAQTAGWHPNVKLSPIIGVYCGNNLYFEATRVILEKLGVKKLKDIEALSYREGKWPGSFYVRTKDGMERSISKLDFNQTIPFYVNKRCLLCIDLTNEVSDLSVGDGWLKEGSSSGGWSLIITRTELGDTIVEEASRSGSITIEEISIRDAELMHSHAFDLKKIGAFERLKHWRLFNLAVPDYDREPPKIGITRKFVEFLITIQFFLCSSTFGRFVFRAAPLLIMGRFFRFLRKNWMKRSKKRH